jgi:hypothetical protein
MGAPRDKTVFLKVERIKPKADFVNQAGRKAVKIG